MNPAKLTLTGLRAAYAAGDLSPAEVLTSSVLERTYGAPMEVLEHGGMLLVTDSPMGIE